MSDLGAMGRAARTLAEAGRAWDPAVAERADQLADRMERGRFHVSVVGEFKRGKSTLVNALVGTAVLPTGVVPVTTVPTEVSYGAAGVTAWFADGRREDGAGHVDIAPLVTESRNPGNRLGVQRVEVRVDSDILRDGLVLVDTPGANSVHAHNDLSAAAAVEGCDAAIVVLSVDAPLSQRERSMVELLRDRGVRCFFVLNKADHLDPADTATVRGYVAEGLGQPSGDLPLWCVAAMPALNAKQAGRPPGPEAQEFAPFEAELRRFTEVELVHERVEAATRALQDLSDRLGTALELSSAAARIDREALSARVARFTAAATAQRAAFRDDAALLRRDVAVLERRLATNLAGFARRAPEDWEASVRSAVAGASSVDLDSTLRRAVEDAVRSGFDSFRLQEEGFAEASWQEMASRMRTRVQQRVDCLRAEASDLFEIRLPEVAVPQVRAEREGFFYLFLRVGSSTEALGRAAHRLLPAALVRRLVLGRARRQLDDEFDKHAGRARYDLTRRLEAACDRFVDAMAAELEATVETIFLAADRAGQLWQMTVEQLAQHRAAEVRLREAIDVATDLCRTHPAGL